jgi:hypothetical protein
LRAAAARVGAYPQTDHVTGPAVACHRRAGTKGIGLDDGRRYGQRRAVKGDGAARMAQAGCPSRHRRLLQSRTASTPDRFHTGPLPHMREDAIVAVRTWDGTTRVASLDARTVEVRQRLADCAKRYDWPGVFAVLDAEPGLVNAARPGGRSWYAPLHQAAHAGTAADVVGRLVELGAWRGLRNAAKQRPVDLARRGQHAHLIGMLEPLIRIEVPAETLRRIQVYFHAVIQARVQHLVDQHALRLPELEVLLELDEPRMSFPVPGLHGRFEFWLEPAGADTRLIVDAFAERHEVTAKEVRVHDHPAPTLVRVPDDRAGFAALVTFAHTYNGYDLHGGTEGLSTVVLPVYRHWKRTGAVPDDVDVLRACLFFQQRSHYWDGGSWDFETEPFVVALLTRIRTQSGGAVPLRSAKTGPQ